MASVSPSHANDIEQQLKEHGTALRDPPSSVDELLKLLNIIEELLIMVDQAPSRSMQDALIPCMMGLIAPDILRCQDMEVKISVAFCISEITRITAPDPPYSDEQMKEVFQLTLATFENLPHASGHCYKKLVSILDTVSRVKSCLMILDLELNDMIIQMFKQFLEIIGSSHSRTVFTAMETIMTDIINDSDEISLGLVNLLLDSVKKERQDVSPISYKLGEKVIASCAAKLKPYLMEAVKSLGTALDDYAQIVANSCEFRLQVAKQNSVNDPQEHLLQPEPDNLCPRDSAQSLHGASKSSVSPGGASVDCNNTITNEVSLKELENPIERSKASEEQGIVENKDSKCTEEMNLAIVPQSVPKKRGRKPKSLKISNDHSKNIADKKDAHKLHKRKSSDMEIVDMVLGLAAVPLKKTRATSDLELTPGNSQKEGTSVLPNQPVSSGSRRKRGRPKKTDRITRHVDPNLISSSRKHALNADVKEEVEDAPDVHLEKEVKDGRVSAEKPWRDSKKTGYYLQTGEQEGFVEGDIASEKRADDSSGQKKTFLQKSSLEDTGKNTGAVNSRENLTEISHSQKLKATKSPKPRKKRKRSGGDRKKAYQMGELDERLVGKRIKVWWPMDKMYYEGVIESFNQTRQRHKVLYTDGEIENLNLYKQRWKLISPDGERTDSQIASPSPTRVHKKGRKPKSADANKVASSSRGEISPRLIEVEARNHDDKTLAVPSSDCSNIDGSAVGASRDSVKIKDDDADFVDGEKLDDDGVRSGEREKLKDDGANSVRPEMLKGDCLESTGCEKLDDDSIRSKGGEELEADGVKFGKDEKLKDDGLQSTVGEKLHDDSTRSKGGKELGVKFGKCEKLKDDGLESTGCEKLHDDSTRSKGGEELVVKFGKGEKLKDDSLESMINENLNDDGVKAKEGEKLDDDGVKSGEGGKLKDVGANSGISKKLKHVGVESVGDETLKDGRAKSKGGAKLGKDGIKSRKAETLKDDDANSGRSEKLKDEGVGSLAADTLKDCSAKSCGHEKLDDNGVKTGEGEKLEGGSANSERSEKMKDSGVESSGRKLKDNGIKSGGDEKVDDNGIIPGEGAKLKGEGADYERYDKVNDGVESVDGEKFGGDNAKSEDGEKLEHCVLNNDANSGGVTFEEGEKQEDDVENSQRCEKLKDDGVISMGGEKMKDDDAELMDKSKKEVLINSEDKTNTEKQSNSGEKNCSISRVNFNVEKLSKSGDELNEETLSITKKTTPRTETTFDFRTAGDVTKRDEEKSDEEKSDYMERTKTISEVGVSEDVTGKK